MLKGRLAITAQGLELRVEGKDEVSCKRGKDETCELTADGLGTIQLDAGVTGTIEFDLSPAAKSYAAASRTSSAVPAVPGGSAGR